MQQREIGRRCGHLFTVTVLLATGALAGPVDSLQPGQWYQFPNSRLRTVVPSPAPAGDPVGLVNYSGGTFDTSRNRLVVWGGGHAAYAGNEVYAFSVGSGQWSRLTNPSASPTAVHTYDQLEYLPNQDTLFAPGGSIWGSGSATQSTWLFGFANNAWSNGGPMPSTVDNFWYYNMTTDYDPLSGKVVVIGLNRSASFDPGPRAWTLTGEGHGWYLGLSGALDTNRRQFVEVGRGNAFAFSVASNGAAGAKTVLATTGPQNIVACDGPGFVFDPVSDRFVGWCGGSSVYSLNPATRVWTQHSASNAVNPGNPYSGSSYKGTFGRFEYMPAYNAFIVVHDIDQDVYAYRLTSGTGSLPQTPSVSLSATPTTVTSGGSTALNWSSANVTACTASGAWSGSRPTSGQQSISNLTSSGTFTLSCTGSNGSAANSVALTVQPASGGGGSTGGGSTGGGSTGGGATGGSTGGSVAANADWASRAAGPGVVRALGFDTQAEWLDHVWDNSGCYADYAPGCRRNAWDQAVKASGAGSVRFDIRSNSHEGAAGNLAVNFSEDYSVQFGANSEFWVQWRQRFDDYVISHDYRETSGNGAWKQIIMGQGDRWLANGSVLKANSCTENDLVVGNVGSRGVPHSYNECGRYSNFDQLMGNVYTRQNQRVDGSGNTTCQYYPTGGNTSGCLKYVGNEWMTFMIHLQLGPQGRARSSSSGVEQPGLINSTYELYVARQGQPLQIAHRQEGLVIPRGQYWVASRGVNPDLDGDPGYSSGWGPNDGHPQAEFGKIWLTPYYTAKDSAETHQNASLWYDELIVSTQAIAAPGGAAAPTPTPTPTPTLVKPTITLSANRTTVSRGATVTLTWSSQNATSCTAFRGWKGSRATSGQQQVGPLTGATAYSLGCKGPGGSAYRDVIVRMP